MRSDKTGRGKTVVMMMMMMIMGWGRVGEMSEGVVKGSRGSGKRGKVKSVRMGRAIMDAVVKRRRRMRDRRMQSGCDCGRREIQASSTGFCLNQAPIH